MDCNGALFSLSSAQAIIVTQEIDWIAAEDWPKAPDIEKGRPMDDGHPPSRRAHPFS